MPTVNQQAPQVQINLPVPTPVQQKPKKAPVRQSPQQAVQQPIQQDEQAVPQFTPPPRLRALILPWTPTQKRMSRRVVKFAKPFRVVGTGGISHQQASEYLAGKQSRPWREPHAQHNLKNKWFVQDPNGDIHVRLHNTNVVTIHKDNSYTVRTGGWHTDVTRRVIAHVTGLRTDLRGVRRGANRSLSKPQIYIQGRPLEEGMKVPILPQAPEPQDRPAETIPEDFYA